MRRTLTALLGAGRFAAGLNARLEVILPHIVPFPLPIEESFDPSFLTGRFKALVEESEIEAAIQVCLCRDRGEALAFALPPGSIVVIGVRGRYWPIREYRLGRELRARGHRVIFVDAQSHIEETSRHCSAGAVNHRL
jgi:hypothetical protein